MLACKAVLAYGAWDLYTYVAPESVAYEADKIRIYKEACQKNRDISGKRVAGDNKIL